MTTPTTPTPQYADLEAKLRRYPACREEAWRLFDKGYCYDDEMDNGPIEQIVIEAADAIRDLQQRCEELSAREAAVLKLCDEAKRRHAKGWRHLEGSTIIAYPVVTVEAIDSIFVPPRSDAEQEKPA